MRADIGTVLSHGDLNGLEIIEDRTTSRRTGGTKGRYSKGRFLGKGGFAKCYEFQDVETKAVFAAKIVAKSMVSKPRTQAKLRSEISIHRSLDHSTVVKFYDYFEDNDNVYIILELCPNQTLNEFMRRRPGKRLSEAEAMFYAHELITCLRYLHGRRVIHRDLKLGNLFLDARARLKVGDFGLAAQLERDGEKKRTICGTPNYIAPEILDGKHGHSYEVDIWSLGVVLYTMLVGRPPFETSDLKTTYRRIRHNQYAFPDNVQISGPAKELIATILRTDPKSRPSLENILSSTWFSSSRLPPAPPPSIDQHSGPSPRPGGASARSETPERGEADFARIDSPAPRCPLLDRSPSANRMLSSTTNRQAPRSPSASATSLRGKPPPTQVPVKSIVARVESSPCRFDAARARDHPADRPGAFPAGRPPTARSGNEENEEPCNGRGTPRATAVPLSATPRTPTMTTAFAGDLPSPCGPRPPDAQGLIPRATSVHHLSRDSSPAVNGDPRDAAAVPGTASQPALRGPSFGLARSATSRPWQPVPAARSFAPPVVLNPKGPSSAQGDQGRATARSSSAAACRASTPQGPIVQRGSVATEAAPCTPGRCDFDRLDHRSARGAPAACGTTTPPARSASARGPQGSARDREASASSPAVLLNALTQGLATPPAASCRHRGAVGERSPSGARNVTGAGQRVSGPSAAISAVATDGEIAAHLPEMWVAKWVDYSSKYGVGYILSDGSIGVYFNDSTKAILAPDGKRFDYITRRTHERPEVRTTHTFEDYPEDMKKKVTLLRHFRGYMLTDSLEHKEGAVPGTSGLPGPPAHQPHPEPPCLPEDGEGSPYVKKWARNKHAIMFQLSNKIVQVVFFDKTEAVLSSRSHTVTYVDKQGQVSSYPLSSALDVPSPELAKRLRYTRDILVGLLGPGRARQASGGA